MDIYTAEKRSHIMSRIRSTGTKAEERLYRLVRGHLGHRWRIERNAIEILGSPDIYIPSLSLVVFLDGCFFHGCPIHGHIPKSNVAYWREKIGRNMQRDRKYTRSLRNSGFSVWRFWEHELKVSRLEQAARRLAVAISRQKNRREFP